MEEIHEEDIVSMSMEESSDGMFLRLTIIVVNPNRPDAESELQDIINDTKGNN